MYVLNYKSSNKNSRSLPLTFCNEIGQNFKCVHKFVSWNKLDFNPKIVFYHKYVCCFYSHKQANSIFRFRMLSVLRELERRGQIWPSPKKLLHSAKPMCGRFASCYSKVFGERVYYIR